MRILWKDGEATLSEQVAVCQFKPDGIQLAQRYLQSIRNSGWMPLPAGLLTDPDYVVPMTPAVYVEARPFANRREAGQYLEEQLASLGSEEVAGNADLWSWLGIFYLESMNQDRTSRQGEYPELAYLIDPQSHDSRDRSHHRLMMAYDIWTQWGERAWYLLEEPASSMGQFALRVVQSPEIFRSEGIVTLAHELYADKATGRLRPRTLGTSQATAPPGSLPRLIAVLNQLSMTYDVYGMTPEQLAPLLPQEFDAFRSSASVA